MTTPLPTLLEISYVDLSQRASFSRVFLEIQESLSDLKLILFTIVQFCPISCYFIKYWTGNRCNWLTAFLPGKDNVILFLNSCYFLHVLKFLSSKTIFGPLPVGCITTRTRHLRQISKPFFEAGQNAKTRESRITDITV